MITRRSVLKCGLTGALGFATRTPGRQVLGDEPSVQPGAKAAGQIFMHTQLAVGGSEYSGVFAIDANTGTWRLVDGDATPNTRVSPDGTTLAYTYTRDRSAEGREPGLWLSPVTGGQARRISDVVGNPLWSPDGRQLIVSGAPNPDDPARYETWRVNADGSAPTRLPLPEPDLVLDWSADGAWLLVCSASEKPGEPPIHFANRPVFALRPDGTERHAVTPGTDIVRWRHRFMPDGKHVIYFQIDGEEDNCLYIVDVAGKDPKRFRSEADELAPFTAIGAPDGRHVAVMRFLCSRNPDGKKRDTLRDCRVEISSFDGKTSRILDLPPATILWLLDWRADKPS